LNAFTEPGKWLYRPIKKHLVLLAAAVCVLLSGCSQNDDLIAEEAQVYEALFAEINPDGRQIFIAQQSVQPSKLMELEINTLRLGKEDFYETKRSLLSINMSHSHPPLPTGKHITILSQEALEDIFESRPKALRWERFHRTYGNNLLHVSRVGFNKVTDRALVYLQSICGSTCGNGHLAYLKKGWLGWEVIWIEFVWIS
jgi:hypothetical protein